MIEPQNDEEWKALRLDNLSNDTDFSEFAHSDSRDHWVKILQSARAIFREEQAANPHASAIEATRMLEREREESHARMIASQKKLLDDQLAQAERLANIPQKWQMVHPSELAKVRDEIRLRSEVLRVFDADMNEVPGYAEAEIMEQMKRLLWLLSRERELMGEEWVTNG